MKHSGRQAKRNAASRVRTRQAGQLGPSDQDVLIRLAAMRNARDRGEVRNAPVVKETIGGVSASSAFVAIVIALVPLVIGLIVIVLGAPSPRPLGW